MTASEGEGIVAVDVGTEGLGGREVGAEAMVDKGPVSVVSAIDSTLIAGLSPAAIELRPDMQSHLRHRHRHRHRCQHRAEVSGRLPNPHPWVWDRPPRQSRHFR